MYSPSSSLLSQARWVLEHVAPDTGSAEVTSGLSHTVLATDTVVLKVGEACGHRRLQHETLIVSELPKFLAPSLLSAGEISREGVDLIWALYKREPGQPVAPVWESLGSASQYRLLAQLIERLKILHAWTPEPGSPADLALLAPAWASDTSDEHFFSSYEQLLSDIHKLAARLPHYPTVRPALDLLSNVTGYVTDLGPAPKVSHHVTHADAHWSNVLFDGKNVTALLDYEWSYYSSCAAEVFRIMHYAKSALPIAAKALLTETPDWVALPYLDKRLRLRHISDCIMVAHKSLASKDELAFTEIMSELRSLIDHTSTLDRSLKLLGF